MYYPYLIRILNYIVIIKVSDAYIHALVQKMPISGCKRQKSSMRKALQFTRFYPYVGKAFAGFA